MQIGIGMQKVLIFVLFVGSAAAQPATQAFSLPCEKIWPHAVQVFTTVGFGVRSSDRAGGVLSLDWRKGAQISRFGTQNDTVRYLTDANTGFWSQYTAFRIDTAMVLFTPSDEGCDVQAEIAFQGWKKRLFDVPRWYALPSSHRLERDLLNALVNKTASLRPAKESDRADEAAKPKPPSPPVAAPAPEAKSAIESKPAPPPRPKTEEPPADTRVVRLPG